MLLSFIVPLYNCERYIATCLDSILAQGLAANSFEVLVVNDGSTDKGPDIVTRYGVEWPNIRLINQENGGVSSARNRGIEEARGEYLYFVDADDWLVAGGMRALFDVALAANDRPDMIGLSHRIVDNYYDPGKWERIRPHRLLFRGSFLDFGQQFGINGHLWTWVISRNLIRTNNLRFRPYVIAEDWLFMVSVFAVCEAVVVKTDLNVYRYRVHGESVTNRSDAAHVIQLADALFDVFRETRTMAETSRYRRENFEEYVGYFRRKLFFCICSASLPLGRVRALLERAAREKFYPIEDPTTWVHRFMNFMCRRPVVVYLFSPLYRHLFLARIKPRLKRN